MASPFVTDFRPEIGVAEKLASGIRRIVAPNASAMTFTGTNTYLVGEGKLSVIDPGPDDDQHLEAILAALSGHERISRILVTHSHLDHTALVPRLVSETGAETFAFGHWQAGQGGNREEFSDTIRGEGIDFEFGPDHSLADNAVISVNGFELAAIWTPGHLGNHLSFHSPRHRILFSGDHVMAWSTTVVAPPGGDMSDFLGSLGRVRALDATACFPGHGPVLSHPRRMIDYQLRHRKDREVQIIKALEMGASSARQIAGMIYADIPPQLLPSAAMNVLAHLLDLRRRGLATTEGRISTDCRFNLT